MTKSRAAKSAIGATDWPRVDAFTDADVERMAKADKENPATVAADWAEATIGLPPLRNRLMQSLTWMSWTGSSRKVAVIKLA